jgi:hypothetical protein
MSERINRLAQGVLINSVYPSLPRDFRNQFPQVTDRVSGLSKNFLIGPIADQGANVAFPAITVWSTGPAESLIKNYKHLSLHLDIWTSGDNVTYRRMVGVLYEYCRRQFIEGNWSGDGVLIKRCWEADVSDAMFDPQLKLWHLAQLMRVEAISATWY